jgi:hypothetical protein
MTLDGFLKWIRGVFRTGPGQEVQLAIKVDELLTKLATAEEKLSETQQRLSILEWQLAALRGSNQTAARALRRITQDNINLLAAQEAAEVRLSIEVSQRQRTVVVNDRLLADLHESENARRSIETEIRQIRSDAVSRSSPT